MNRSSMRRVETTYDKEKRLAYKQRLMERIEAAAQAPEPQVHVEDDPLLGKTVWHPELGAGTVRAVDARANSVQIDFADHGELELVFTEVRSKLIPVEQAPSHVPQRLYEPPTPPAKKMPAEVRRLSVSVPLVFKTLKPSDQYAFLTYERHLTPEDANDMIAVFNGKPPFNRTTLFELTWDTQVPVPEPKKSETVEKVSSDLQPLKLPAGFSDEGVQRIIEEVEVVKKQVRSQKLSVLLPQAFKTWKAADQFVFLTKTKRLTTNEANDVIDVFQNKTPLNSRIQYEISWDE